MRTKKWLKEVAYIGKSKIADDEDSDVYYSKFDNSYITGVGMEKSVKFLADREITKDLTHGVGFSPKDGKWYGWSHRAIFGFKIGSTCEKGDCHYFAANEADMIEGAIRFWDDECHENTTAVVSKPGQIKVEWLYNDKVPNKDLRGTIGGTISYYDHSFGRGEWVAKTIEDAKQMAIDFNKGVS